MSIAEPHTATPVFCSCKPPVLLSLFIIAVVVVLLAVTTAVMTIFFFPRPSSANAPAPTTLHASTSGLRWRTGARGGARKAVPVRGRGAARGSGPRRPLPAPCPRSIALRSIDILGQRLEVPVPAGRGGAAGSGAAPGAGYERGGGGGR